MTRWPVIYSTTAIQEKDVILGRTIVALSVLLLILGVWYFRHTEKTFADVV